MTTKTLIKVAALIMGLSTVMALAVSCTSGRSESEFKAVQDQLSAKEKEVADLKQQIEAAKTQNGNPILSAVPNAPPRATPTPVPPGYTPSPPPQPPANKTVPLAFYVDTVTSGRGESQFKVDPSLSCARSSVFKRGMHIVWRMQVADTSTGKVVQRDDVERATLKLPNGDTRNFAYGRHGATDDTWIWTTAWDVPTNYPLGTIDYSIEVVTKSGVTGTFKEIPVSNPQSGVESRLQVVE